MGHPERRRREVAVVVTAALAAAGCGLITQLDGLKGTDAGMSPDASPDSPPGTDGSSSDAAPTQPLFYMDLSRVGDAQPQAVPMVAYPNGDAAPQALGCATPIDPAVFLQSISRSPSGNYVGPKGYPPPLALNRGHSPASAQVPPGDAIFVFNAGVSSASAILAVDETSRCGSPLRRIEPFDAGLFTFQFPRFRADGKRVAYLGKRSASALTGVYTVAVDGSEPPRLLFEAATVMSTPPVWIDGPQPKVMWVDSTGVVYAQQDGPSVKETVTSCSERVWQVEYLDKPPFQRVLLELGGRISWLPYGDDCSKLNALVTDPAGVVEQDFAISPDKALVAYVSNRGEAADAAVAHTHVWLVDSSGGAPTSCTPADPNSDDVGPRWFAGGSQLVWTRIPRPAATTPSALMIADVVAGKCQNLRTVVDAAPSAGTTHFVMGSSNQGCSAGGRPSEGAGWVVAMLAALAAARRRVRGPRSVKAPPPRA